MEGTSKIPAALPIGDFTTHDQRFCNSFRLFPTGQRVRRGPQTHLYFPADLSTKAEKARVWRRSVTGRITDETLWWSVCRNWAKKIPDRHGIRRRPNKRKLVFGAFYIPANPKLFRAQVIFRRKREGGYLPPPTTPQLPGHTVP